MMERIGNCRVVGEIGSGGMAVIYKAVQDGLDRPVAIKALKPSIAIDSQFAQRFEREAHFMAQLQHENILHVYDYIKDGNSMFIVMEYVRGIDLYDLLERTAALPPEVAAVIALQVARALDYVHFRGIVHRDIKPANVMIAHNGGVKLMDFGIARADNLSDLTETGTGLGTPSYMSPEQILGDRLDFRSDVFSLGIVLYQMVTGRKPFVEDDAHTVMQKIRLDRYTPPRKVNEAVPRPLERILARCMEKLPANRYPTTQALIDDLVEFLAPRVPINHAARVVMFLRDIDVVASGEAEQILSAGGPRTSRRGTVERGVLRSMVKAQSGLLLAAALSGGIIQVAHGRFSADADSLAGEAAVGLDPEQVGYLRVNADPWAEVFVDGQLVVTTPAAGRIALSPGRHYVKFTNPFYRTANREVRVQTGETVELVVTLEPAAVDANRSGSRQGAGP